MSAFGLLAMTRPTKPMSWGNSGRRIIELKGFAMWKYLAILIAGLTLSLFITAHNAGAETGNADEPFNTAAGETLAAMNPDELGGDGIINFRDFAVMAEDWLNKE